MILSLTLWDVAIAQAPDPGNDSTVKYELRERLGVMIPMRDGVRISADIYLPKKDGTLPVLLTMTPYDNIRARARAEAQWFAKRGYGIVAVDVRGRYDSEGDFDPFHAKHKTDGYDLIEWIAKQPWSSGRVGMMGVSYGGWTQWWTATTAPPHLVAIAPRSAPPDAFENDPYQNGVLSGGWFLDWSAWLSGRTLQIKEPGGYGGWIKHREDFKHTPYSQINDRRGLESAPWFKTWYENNKSSDPYWKAIAYQGEENFSKVGVPSLSMTGWFDVSYPGTPQNYLGMKAHGATPEARRPAMIVGPWTHGGKAPHVVGGIDYGKEAAIDANGHVVRWFDHYLKGIDNGVEKDPRVRVFVMGANRWRSAEDWPLPQTQFTKYYLSSQGRANSAKGNGVLATAAPKRETCDSFDYDPKKPTLDAFGSNPDHNGHIDGAVDTQPSAAGDEVLVYQTPPLDAPVEVTGPIEATIYASTSAKDTDWFVRLVDVQPDGKALLLAEGAMRARNRDPHNEGRFNAAQLSTVEPGKTYQYTIKFWRDTANVFLKGHRIRVEISSSWFPFFLPNLNTGADNLAMVSGSEAVVARQTICHGPRFPSHLALPVIPN